MGSIGIMSPVFPLVFLPNVFTDDLILLLGYNSMYVLYLIILFLMSKPHAVAFCIHTRGLNILQCVM